MTEKEEQDILNAVFETVDYIGTLHLTGGGEPFLHPHLARMIECAMGYEKQFDRLMLFTNCTVPVPDHLMNVLRRFSDKLLVQVSQYGQFPDREQEILRSLLDNDIPCKVVKYFGDDQDFGGWVDFGPWTAQGCSAANLETRFRTCAVTDVMHGNWRTRDGKVHWCSRSQRGMELGLIPDDPEDYVDLFETATREEKQQKFAQIAAKKYLSACDFCSGDQGTSDPGKRHQAAEQMERGHK